MHVSKALVPAEDASGSDQGRDRRADPEASAASGGGVVPGADAACSMRSQPLVCRLRTNLERFRAEDDALWKSHAHETAVVTWLDIIPGEPAEHWLLDFGSLTITPTGREAQDESDWDVAGSATAWEQVMAGTLNLSVALRSCQIRYCDNDQTGDPLAADARTALLARLLGVIEW